MLQITLISGLSMPSFDNFSRNSSNVTSLAARTPVVRFFTPESSAQSY